jgi:integral membrane protein
MLKKDLYSNFLLVAHIEGISYLLLLFLAMPLKYFFNMPEAVRYTGMAHGLLFVLYMLLLIYCMSQYNWNVKKGIIAFVAALLPFATFYLNKWLGGK